MAFTERTELLVGKDILEKIKNTEVAIFGLGGVGSFALEALARLGFGNFLIVDNDVIEESNINRQIFALSSTLGKSKVEVAKERVLDINPLAKVEDKKIFFRKEYAEILKDCNYVVDAVDTIASKIDLIEFCYKNNIPIISCMGAANRLDPKKFLVADIYSTSVCPVCRVLRKELKIRNIKNLKVVYSTEIPKKIKNIDPSNTENAKVLGSISFVPSAAGLILASEVFYHFFKIRH